jgi:hypothetical protein
MVASISVGIDQRAVVAQAHHVVGGMGVQGAGQAGQLVVKRAAMDGDRLAPDHGLQGVVGGSVVVETTIVDPPGPRHPLDLAHDQRRPEERHRRPARQAFGAHAGLEDGEDQGD